MNSPSNDFNLNKNFLGFKDFKEKEHILFLQSDFTSFTNKRTFFLSSDEDQRKI